LLDNNACYSQVELFTRIFPAGAVWPDDQLRAEMAGLDVVWAMRKFRLSGVVRRWWEHGQLKYEHCWDRGRLHGLCRSWYSDGQLAFEGYYDHGRLHGACRHWRESGQLEYESHYDQGILQYK
jgi:antitoxin component YwqK of YwqJK toxin-antitoxin module